jgi:ArsR family metal-binding transcriptional regulator
VYQAAPSAAISGTVCKCEAHTGTVRRREAHAGPCADAKQTPINRIRRSAPAVVPPLELRRAQSSGGNVTDQLLDSIEITHTLPCLADPSKIRFHARAPADLDSILPYLNTQIKGAIYNHALPALTFTRGHRIICLHSRLITGAKTEDVEDARAVLDWLMELINTTWARRDDIAPSYERREQLTPVDIYKLLPRTNCRRCGLPTCLAFAVELGAEKQNVIRCAQLFDAAQVEKRQLLIAMLADAGYEIPDPFRPAPEDA